jgi:hypothetical protein
MLKTYYLIGLDLKIVLTTLHKGGGGKNHCSRRERANKLLVSTIFARDIKSKDPMAMTTRKSKPDGTRKEIKTNRRNAIKLSSR